MRVASIIHRVARSQVSEETSGAAGHKTEIPALFAAMWRVDLLASRRFLSVCGSSPTSPTQYAQRATFGRSVKFMNVSTSILTGLSAPAAQYQELDV